MKTKEQIEAALGNVDSLAPTQYPSMTYESGVEEALRWVLEEISDEEFAPAEGS